VLAIGWQKNGQQKFAPKDYESALGFFWLMAHL
jgi:hypothetical protein